MSAKRRTDAVKYSDLRRSMLNLHPCCQLCGVKPSTDIHHKEKRGRNYLNPETFMVFCRGCHDEIHSHPAWAREMGYLK